MHVESPLRLEALPISVAKHPTLVGWVTQNQGWTSNHLKAFVLWLSRIIQRDRLLAGSRTASFAH